MCQKTKCVPVRRDRDTADGFFAIATARSLDSDIQRPQFSFTWDGTVIEGQEPLPAADGPTDIRCSTCDRSAIREHAFAGEGALSLVYNERAKLTATFINGVAIALVAIGILAPAIVSFSTTASLSSGLLVVMAICAMGAGVLHFVARLHLGKLKP